MTVTAPVEVGTLEVPGASLHYELRGSGPLVVLIGAPMDARPFTPLAELLAADHAVLTTDPRGINRSTVEDRDQDSTAHQRGEDLARLIEHVDAGPAVVVGSSGGAVSGLALVEARPALVDTLVAHEPPVNEILDDREDLREKTRRIVATHEAGDRIDAWRQFMALANLQMPEEMFQEFFGKEPAPQDAADNDFQQRHMLIPTTAFVPDVAVLQAASTRVLIGLGEASGRQLCDRTSRALASELGTEPTMFPGGHTGFAEDPVAFAARLRQVLPVGGPR